MSTNGSMDALSVMLHASTAMTAKRGSHWPPKGSVTRPTTTE